MGSVAIVGLREDASALSMSALSRLRGAAHVVVPSAESDAARLAREADIAARKSVV